MTPPPISAIVWDFDNTLVDSSARNRSVTRRIVHHITGSDPDTFEELRHQHAYDRWMRTSQDWRRLYSERFGMPDDQINAAGRLWDEFQAVDVTPTPWFPGMVETLADLDIAHGIVSLNTRDNIEARLDDAGMRPRFRSVIGCRDVPREQQKPSPLGLLRCFEELAGPPRGEEDLVIYVGDHAIDAECAARADASYREQGLSRRVLSVAACYGVGAGEPDWDHPPHHTLGSPSEMIPLVERLASPS